MCTGRVDLAFVVRAFAKGCDGVFIGGCHLGECHYITEGNHYALNMVLLARRILAHLGLSPERLGVEWVSSGEGTKFAETMSNFGARLRELGPLGTGEGLDAEAVRDNLKEVESLVPHLKLELRDKLAERLQSEQAHEEHFTAEEVARLLDEAPAFKIDPERCKACGACAKQCPEEAIEGASKVVHKIDQGKCIRCGQCLEACPPKFNAVEKLVGGASS